MGPRVTLIPLTRMENGLIDRIKQENEQLKWQKTCKVCFVAEVETVLLPCCHVVCCERCVVTIDDCPVCNKRIIGHARVYLT